MIPHGVCADGKGAAKLAVTAGCDMDMESRCYKNNLEILVNEKSVDISLLDDAVRRILTKKFELGIYIKLHTSLSPPPLILISLMLLMNELMINLLIYFFRFI
jgi:beta-glucosidase-like glycosyl hydrolase